MYEDVERRSPDSKLTDIEYTKSNVSFNKNERERKKNTCPKPRRPNKDGICPPNFESRLNKQGNVCCYKKKVVRDDCPPGRTPINGECNDGFKIKKNKKGYRLLL